MSSSRGRSAPWRRRSHTTRGQTTQSQEAVGALAQRWRAPRGAAGGPRAPPRRRRRRGQLRAGLAATQRCAAPAYARKAVSWRRRAPLRATRRLQSQWLPARVGSPEHLRKGAAQHSPSPRQCATGSGRPPRVTMLTWQKKLARERERAAAPPWYRRGRAGERGRKQPAPAPLE